MTRVLGVVIARDEWPGLALAVTHALTQVDVVLVLDHGSIDGTPSGLESLRTHFGERLEVMRFDDVPYWQEAITNLAIAVRGVDDVDWIYVFDADEFVLVPACTTLRDILHRAPATCRTIRYEVQNFVVPFDFDPCDIEQFARIEHRSLPCNVVDLPHRTAADEIEHAALNYFDLHFQSKVIVRATETPWLIAGAHDAPSELDAVELRLEPHELRVAHLPFDGAGRLHLRAAHGRRLVEQGFPLDHGWQSQMLARIDASGQLDQFWVAHSIGAPVDDVDRTPPTTTIDLAVAEACRAAAATVHAALDTAPVATAQNSSVDHLAMRPVLAALHAAQRARSAATGRAVSAEQQLLVERTALAAMRRRREELREHNDRLARQLGRAEHAAQDLHERLDAVERRHELDATQARSQLDASQRYAAELDAHRSDLQRELDAIWATRVWRWSAPLRRVRARLRQ